MTDCYWIQRPEESLKWEDINLRRNLTKEHREEHANLSYKVAILGENIAIGTTTGTAIGTTTNPTTTRKHWKIMLI